MSETPDEQTTVTEDVTLKRSPRYFRFMFAGAVVFALIALGLTFAFPENPTYSRAQVFGFLLIAALALGVGVGSLVALAIDRAANKRVKTVQADRLDVRVTSDDTHNPIES
ncbi:MAG TPA: hypothetical protein VGI08_10490 [Diaminobutyricibacter sp.]